MFDITTEFKGFEDITVPAGSCKTCKFDLNYSATLPDGSEEGSRAVIWYASNYGVAIQSLNNGTISKRVEADLNGIKR